MRYAAEPAFVLHARPWRETSLLVEVLSAGHGRLGLVARGVQGPKRQALRAALQPLQAIRFDAVHKGELAQLAAAEAVDVAPRLHGDAALAGFYVNELCLRLAPRQAPLPALFLAYAQARARLGSGEPLAWTLRRFERDLLEALGLAPDWRHDAAGQPLMAEARYRLDPQHGLLRLQPGTSADRGHSASGRALQALAGDEAPAPADLASLRLPLRLLLQHHLGGRGLAAWELRPALARALRPAQK